jgi:cysteine synthase A
MSLTDLKVLPIGRTPLFYLGKNTYIKLEQFNLGGSIKSRVALTMIKDAIKRKILLPHKNQTVLESSGGNTGIALAILAHRVGYLLKLVIPDNYSSKKIDMLRRMGSEVILSNHKEGNDSHVKLAKKISKDNPDYIYLDQFSNPSNIEAHYSGTGAEIVNSLDQIDVFVSGIGSGGTITGAELHIKEKFPLAKIYGILPKRYSIENNQFIPHKIQGIGIGLKPKIYNSKIVDDFIEISEDELKDCAKLMLREYGLFLGISSLANVAALLKIKANNSEACCVTVSPDAGYDYPEFYNNL